ncbi:MAG: endonuclease III [Chloroflexi bacterium]|nr:endonuclease III [Chloroflexota bacterium]
MVEVRAKEAVGRIVDLLREEYGPPDRQTRDGPVSVLVQTILSQNTSDVNSGAAFGCLLAAFNNWEEVAEASVDTLITCIRRGGLAKIKAQRIKQVLGQIVQERGRLELGFLRQLGPAEAEAWLTRLPGVGLKTARCVLLFSFGLPALPVDTHILRVSKRLGLLSPGASLEEAHRILGVMVPPEYVYDFHVLMIEHGRRTCRARNPNCRGCVLREICPSYSLFVRD